VGEDKNSPNRIGLEFKLEKAGLFAGVKSRALAAFDRLLGSLIDIPSTYLEEIVNECRNKGL